MDRTNILQIFDELTTSMEDCNLSINFSTNKQPEVDEPCVLIYLINPKNIVVNYYLTSQEAQEITKEELEQSLTMLVKQEEYRRKIIFKNATISTKVKWE